MPRDRRSDPNKHMNLAKIDLALARSDDLLPATAQRRLGPGDPVISCSGGDQNRRLRAFDAESGKVLWRVPAAIARRHHGHVATGLWHRSLGREDSTLVRNHHHSGRTRPDAVK